MQPTLEQLLDRIVDAAIQDRVTPGAALLVFDEGVEVLERYWGCLADPSDEGAEVDATSIYDAASLTKPAVTSTLMMQLVRDGQVDLDEAAVRWLPELTGAGSDAITVQSLMGHGSGLPAHLEFYQRIWNGETLGHDSPRDTLAAMAGAEELERPPGESVVYSDLGYILLGRLIERVLDQRLDEAYRERVTAPLGMSDTHFVDLLSAAPSPLDLDRVAPTEVCPRRGRVHGEVHDENCHAGGGICGHAGLFTTVRDLSRQALELCRSVRGESDFLPAEILQRFWTATAVPGASMHLGWDSPSGEPGASHAGDLWPTTGVGHLGFTGTSLWMVPERGRFVVFFDNRVYYGRHDTQTENKALRRAVMDSIVEYLPPL